MHLIVTQSADGTLVVGDSHHATVLRGRAIHEHARVEALILQAFREALGLEPPPVVERWSRTYASVEGMAMFVDAPTPCTRLVMVTSGTGASTAFAIAEEVIGDLYGRNMTPRPSGGWGGRGC